MDTENMIQLGRVYKGDHSSYTLVKLLAQMKRLAIKDQRISTWACNGTKYNNPRGEMYNWPDFEYTQEMEKADSDKVRKAVDKVLLELNSDHKFNCWHVEYQGDPRGYTLRLYYRYPRDGEHKDYKGLFIDLLDGWSY